MKSRILALVFFLATTPGYFAFAADHSVMPLLIDHAVEPRDSVSETVKNSNTSNHPIRLFPTVNEIQSEVRGRLKSSYRFNE